MRSQTHWDEHAALMDQWTADGFILLGGPIGEGEDEVLLVFNATNEDEIRLAFAADPWFILQIRELAQIRRWKILLEAEKMFSIGLPAALAAARFYKKAE